MALQKTIVNQKNEFLISCPFCNQINRMTPADIGCSDRLFKVFGMQGVYICQCKCKRKFNLKLDLRRKFRRAVGLAAFYTNLSSMNIEDKFAYKDENSYGIRHNSEIMDISVEGLRLKPMVKHYVQEGDSLLVKFDLGGKGTNRVVEKRLIVHSVKNNLIGGEFFPRDKNDPRIGFYLL